jgi:hypothetical protein
LTISASRAAPGPIAGAGATVTIAAQDTIRVGAGAVAWPELLSSGRLVLAGDPFLALRSPSLFRLPARDSAGRRAQPSPRGKSDEFGS